MKTFTMQPEVSTLTSDGTLGTDLPALRIALVYSACHTRGGVERVLLEASNYLRHAGHEISVLASEFADPSAFAPGIHRVHVPYGRAAFGLGLPLFKRAAQKVIQTQGYDLVAGFGVQAPDDSVLWVQSVHASWWEQCRYRRRGLSRLRQQCNPFHSVVLSLERRMFSERRYRRLIALSPAVKSDLQRFYDVPAEDVEILPNGFRSAEFNLGLRARFRASIRQRLRIPENAWVALFVANEWERKGLRPLMEALTRAPASEMYLIVAGRLPQRLLAIEAERMGLGGRVRFVGGSESVNQWFGAADVFVLPTLYEAWGMVVIEAMACGLPVLTSAEAGAAIAVKEGASGFLLTRPQDPEEILAGLLKLQSGVSFDPALIAASVSGYEWTVLLEKYQRILRECL